MKEIFRNQALMAYIGAQVILWVIVLIEPGEDSPPKDFLFLLVLAASLALTSILLIGWHPYADDYPLPNHRRKAIALWLYGTPIAVVIGVFMWSEASPWWVQLAAYVLSFVFLTTLTFGILPGYGGAYNEYYEVEQRRRELRYRKRDFDDWKFSDDKVIEKVDEVCETCLSALLPDDESCWRCGIVVRLETHVLKSWTEDKRSRWKKKKKRDQKFWERIWRPNYLYKDESGARVVRLGVRELWAYVDSDGCWSLIAWASTKNERIPHMVLLDKRKAPTPKYAKDWIEEIVVDTDFKRIVEEG